MRNYMRMPANSMRASSRTPVMVAKEDGGAVDLDIGAIPINREGLAPALEGKDDECVNSPTPELLDLPRIRVAATEWIEVNPNGQADFIWVCNNASPCFQTRGNGRFLEGWASPPLPRSSKSLRPMGRRLAIQAGDILIVMTAKFARVMLAVIALPLFCSSEHGLTERVFL